MAEVQDSGNTNLLKRSLPDTEDAGLKKQRVVDGVETDNSGDTAVVLQELDEIGANITEILDKAEKEKERITRESAEAVQQRLQDRARVLEQLPGFWGIALRQSLARDYITEDDDKLLDYLVDVAEVENLLHITLRFAEDNPYLDSTEITRLVVPYDPNTAAQVSPVSWKPGKELSPATDDNGSGTFDSCNFFQRITCLPTFDTVDQILHDIFWDPMKYYNGTADLAAERLQHQFVEEVEDEEGEGEEEQDEEVYAGMENALEQDPAAVQEGQGSSDEEAGSDAEDDGVELNVEDQDGEDDDEDEDADDGDDGDAL